MEKFNLIGQVFGRLTVLEELEPKYYGRRNLPSRRFLCSCECGKKKIIAMSSLRRGLTTSCGCFRTEKTVARSFKHGHGRRGHLSNTYISRANMIQRCCNSKNKDFECP